MAYLSGRVRLAINEKQKYFSFTDPQLAENLILVCGSTKGQKRNKNEFVTKFIGIIVMIIVI